MHGLFYILINSGKIIKIMLKVALHIFDSRKFTVSEIVDLLQLSNEEIKPFEKFTNEEVRKEKIVSYFYKKVFAPDYQINENGKPISNNLFFNISHSKGLVVFASNNKFDIGVDVEQIRPVEENLKQYISNEKELTYMENDEKFFEIWTSKESLVKCIGKGIKGQPRHITALPLNGIKVVDNKTYNCKILKWKDFVISITLNDKNDYQINLSEDNFI